MTQKINLTKAALAAILPQLPPGTLGSGSGCLYDEAAQVLTCPDAVATLINAADQTGVVAARIKQLAALRAACSAAITGGMSSSALGAPHTYPTDATSQANLIASVVDAQVNVATANWSTPFWCADASGNWSFAPHTATQMIQAGQDVKAAIVAAQQKLATLTAQVNAATAPALIAQAVW